MIAARMVVEHPALGAYRLLCFVPAGLDADRRLTLLAHVSAIALSRLVRV